MTSEEADTSGDYIHTGGWCVVHPDNSCEISLVECWEREDVNADQLGDWEVDEAGEGVEGAFVEKIRKTTQANILKNL